MADSPLPAEIGEVQRIYSLALRTLWPDMADGVRIYLYDKVATAGAADITQSQIYGALGRLVKLLLALRWGRRNWPCVPAIHVDCLICRKYSCISRRSTILYFFSWISRAEKETPNSFAMAFTAGLMPGWRTHSP